MLETWLLKMHPMFTWPPKGPCLTTYIFPLQSCKQPSLSFNSFSKRPVVSNGPQFVEGRIKWSPNFWSEMSNYWVCHALDFSKRFFKPLSMTRGLKELNEKLSDIFCSIYILHTHASEQDGFATSPLRHISTYCICRSNLYYICIH